MPLPPAARPVARRWMLLAAALLLVVLAAIPAVTIAAEARTTQNERQVRICHATGSESNPYVEQTPAIASNGDLQGGHLDHEKDIIPPFVYVDANGETQTYPGKNWEAEGQAIWQNRCEPLPPPAPETWIAVVKHLSPADDSGRFALEINGQVAGGASAVGNEGTTGPIVVDPGTYTVSESGASGTQLSDYVITTRCTTSDGTEVASANGPSVSVTVREGDKITCAITNTADARPESVSPVLECVVFSDSQPDVAFWGYDNGNGHAVTIPVGDENSFSPAPANRNQPTTFEVDRGVGVVQTPFDASSGNLVWTLSGNTATAGADSQACNPTVEVRKVSIPADDPGVFQLRINGAVVATGGNGTTSGPLRTGIGEGTVTETAAPGTRLADYDSRVECTRNGTVAVSVPGTKVDGAVAQGDVVVCTFTNTRKGTPPQPPTPPPPPQPPPDPLPPVPPTPPGPAPRLDLVVTKTVAPATVVVGGRLTWTMTVTNRSAVAAADVNGVKLDDPRSSRTRLISIRPSQGTCRPFTCNLGRLAPGASATVTAVTEANRVGAVVNLVRVGSEEIESNYRNNVAAALALVIEPLTVCRTLTAEPRILQGGRSSVIRVQARNALQRPVSGLSVRARGAGIDRRAKTDSRGIARFPVSPRRLGLMLFSGDRARTVGPVHCRTLLGVLGAADTQVTG